MRYLTEDDNEQESDDEAGEQDTDSDDSSNEETVSDDDTTDSTDTDENTKPDGEEVREESTDSEDDGEDDASGEAAADDEDLDVYSSIEDDETSVRVDSASDELDGKSLVVTVLGASDAIGADHDLYDIHVLDENGSLYSLENPVTVYLPANGYVSNVYYLGNI